jgi:beta-barrel assembly-enhancing protease
MAHEISHVVMQHSARDAGKQQTTQTLGVLGAIIAGAVLGNGIGGQLASGAIQLGAGAISMSYSRADESEADLLGAQIMYDAGYNPYSMAEFFQKLAQQQSGGGVQFLSDHPNPGNRAESIRNVIQRFPKKSYPRSDSPEFVAMKRVAVNTKAYTAQQIAQHKGPWNLTGTTATGLDPGSASASNGSIERVTFEQVRPSGSWQPFKQGGIAFDYPSNWQLSVKRGGILVAPTSGVAPNGAVAYGVSIHFIEPGKSNAELARQFANDIVQGNPGMKILGGPNRLHVNGAEALSYDLVGNSPVHDGGSRPMRERDWLVTLPRLDGSSVALVFTAPDRDYTAMKQTFQELLRSFRLQ